MAAHFIPAARLFRPNHPKSRSDRPISPGTSLLLATFRSNRTMENEMRVEGQIKEAAGYVKEEANEHGKSAESRQKAQEGRNLRNEGRIEDGKAPKTDAPGTKK